MSVADPLHHLLHGKAFAKEGEAVWIPLGTYVRGFPSSAAVLASPLQSLWRVTSATEAVQWVPSTASAWAHAWGQRKFLFGCTANPLRNKNQHQAHQLSSAGRMDLTLHLTCLQKKKKKGDNKHHGERILYGSTKLSSSFTSAWYRTPQTS